MAKKQSLEERFLELRLEGKTYQAISEELGVSKQSLFNWSKDRKVSDLMKFAHLVRLQVIVRKYQMNREASIEKYGRLLQRGLEELEKRNLAEIPSDKLLRIVFDLHRQIQIAIPDSQEFKSNVEIGFGMNENFAFDVLD